MDINVIVINGRLTKDAEKKAMANGTAIVSFSIASGYRKKSGDQWKDETNFFEVVYLGRGAESIFQYLTKGRQVTIEGELRQNRWEQDGQKRSKVVILANSVQLLSDPNKDKAPVHEAPKQVPTTKGPESFVDDEDIIPF